MATLTTKYDMGDTVWFATTEVERRRHECPDCKGARTWKAISPAGSEFEVPCPRCSTSYMGNHALSLDYSMFAPRARRLTVGQIRASTEKGDSFDAGNRYMCRETGVGSGSVYSEADLFPTEEEALAAAQVKASLTNQNPDFWIAKQFNETAKFCDYELKDAAMEAAQSASRAALSRVGYLIEDLTEAETLSEVKERLQRWADEREAA